MHFTIDALAEIELPLITPHDRRNSVDDAEAMSLEKIKQPTPVIDHGIGRINLIDEKADLKVEQHRERCPIEQKPSRPGYPVICQDAGNLAEVVLSLILI